MIPERVAAAQLNRLGILRSFPADEEQSKLREMLEALRQSTANPEHCRRVVDTLIRRSVFAPLPAEIWDVAEHTSASSEADHARTRSCQRCGGTGYEPGWVLVTYTATSGGGARKIIEPIPTEAKYRELRAVVDGISQFAYEGVRRCVCSRLADEYNRGGGSGDDSSD